MIHWRFELYFVENGRNNTVYGILILRQFSAHIVQFKEPSAIVCWIASNEKNK